MAETERLHVAGWVAREGKPQEISNTIWALATMGTKDATVMTEAICKRSVVDKVIVSSSRSD